MEMLLDKEYWMPNIRDKIQKVIGNYVPCILAEKKQSGQQGFLNSILKEEVPLDHIDHLGPLLKKAIFLIIDAFSKFV